jgi:acyl-coenzyme A thioesterase PaaI-like protein
MPLALIAKPGFWTRFGVSRTLNVTYLRPVPNGEVVLVECEILDAGRRMCSLRGVMRRESDGKVLVVCEHGKFNTDPEVSSKV